MTVGEYEIRGPWVASSYYHPLPDDRFTEDGWFRTDDVVSIDSRGCIEFGIGRRTSSSLAENGLVRSRWRMRSWGTPPSPKQP